MAHFFNKVEWELSGSSAQVTSSTQLEEIISKLNRLLKIEQVHILQLPVECKLCALKNQAFYNY